MSKTPAQRARKHGAQAVPGKAPASPAAGRAPAKATQNANLIIIAGTVASLFLFAYLHLLTLDQMTQLSEGLAMPDSLIGGYDAAYIEQLRGVLDEADRGQLNFVHKTAGTLFPLIFAFTWMLLINEYVRSRGIRWAMWAVPILFAIVDLWENVMIDNVLAAGTLDAGAVGLASFLTTARWVLLALCLLVAIAAVVINVRQRRSRPEPAGAPG
jgi:hypothetical protein